MKIAKITKFAFIVGDVISWLFVIISIATVVLFFVPPAITTWSVMDLSDGVLAFLETVNILINGVGFYLLTRRKLLGFVLITLTFVLNVAMSKLPMMNLLSYTTIILLIVGLPWALSYRETVNEAKT